MTGVGRRGGANGRLIAPAPNEVRFSSAAGAPTPGATGAPTDGALVPADAGTTGGTTGGTGAAATTGGAYGGVGAHACTTGCTIGSGGSTGVAVGIVANVLGGVGAPNGTVARTAGSGARVVELGNSSAHRTLAPTGIRPPQIEHRARRLAPVTLAGSTRKTEWHSGHETFMTRQSR